MAHSLSLNIYRVATNVRRPQSAALRNQMVRAAMSIPTNLVEGTGQKTAREYARFVRIAINSASELEYHLMVARDIKAISMREFETLSADAVRIRKMLFGLLRHLEAKLPAAPRAAAADGPGVVTG
jgi:four helix bundle protein